MDIAGLIADPKRIELVAQPIVDAKRAEIVGYELLSRFQLEPRSSPDLVFAEADRQGLGAHLNEVVIRKALALAGHRPANCFITVNVEPRHLLDSRVVSTLCEPDSLAGIVIELTEHHELPDMRQLTHSLDRLRALGAIIAVDDAGSGYSGLRQLIELRPQLIKLDRALICNIDEDVAKFALVQMLGELVGRLDGWLLAEGVETENELRVLQQIGVPLLQGYFLARPGPPWVQLTQTASAALRLRKPSSGRIEAARHLLEPCAVCVSDEAWPERALALRVSTEGRPSAMRFVHDGVTYLRTEAQLLRVKPTTPLAQIAERAVTRAEAFRWDPIVCIDEAGHLVGVVRLHRLISALAHLQRNDSTLLSDKLN
jgi:EAL domain-containing protein (putative c-di-GMP-specific phosphodiesterase class I)